MGDVDREGAAGWTDMCTQKRRQGRQRQRQQPAEGGWGPEGGWGMTGALSCRRSLPMLHCCCTRYIALQHSMPSMQHAQPPAEHVLEQLTCAHDDAKVVDGQPKAGAGDGDNQEDEEGDDAHYQPLSLHKGGACS